MDYDFGRVIHTYTDVDEQALRLTSTVFPGVTLRYEAVFDTSPGEHRMAPFKIDFVRKDGDGADAAPSLVGHFERDAGHYVLFNRQEEVEEMLAYVGFPLQCATCVRTMLRLTAGTAAHRYMREVAITVVVAPRSVVDEHEEEEEEDADEDEDDVEEEEGAAREMCAICKKKFVVGSATVSRLPCSHAYHKRCVRPWRQQYGTCPYCRRPVEEEETW